MARGRPSKKQQILDTAQTLFAELGYQGTTIDLVVQRAGVSKPTVYNNFPTKQELWLATLDRVIDAANEELEALIVDEEDDWIDNVLTAFTQISQRPELLSVYRIMLGEQHKMEEDARERFISYEQHFRTWCERMLEEHQASLSTAQRFTLMALCREALLTPALLNQPTTGAADLRATLVEVLGLD